MVRPYDAIVIGARCAGSPTAMLLARRGWAVLLVDKATFPSDTISTHLIHTPGVAALERWGLRDRLMATGCPPIRRYRFDLGPVVIAGAPGPDGNAVSYCPRRTILDQLLVDAAVESGVEVREGFTVDELEFDDGRVVGTRGHGKGGSTVVDRARVVVGADGLHSLVARAVDAEAYLERPPLEAGYYSYWSDLPTGGTFDAYDRGDRMWAACETHDRLTILVLSWPIAQFEANRADAERHYLESFSREPSFRDRLAGARREDRLYGMTVPNYFRKPYGPGWVLVGDAAYNKDFITAQGISDAFRDAEGTAAALDRALSGDETLDAAMAAHQATRDAQVRPMYEFTCQFASMAPPPPEMQQLFGAIAGNQPAMDGFAQMMAGAISPAAFFAPENVGPIMAQAARRPS